MKKKVLITGGSGLLAVNWASSIRDKYEVTLLLHHRKISPHGLKIDTRIKKVACFECVCVLCVCYM